MISNFKLFPNFNISQNFVENAQKQKNTFVLSWLFQMLTALHVIIFLNFSTIFSHFKFIPYFNMLKHFVQNVKKLKWTSILSCLTVYFFLQNKPIRVDLCILIDAIERQCFSSDAIVDQRRGVISV